MPKPDKADRHQKQITKCEEQIAHLNEEKAEVEALIADPDNTNDAELQAELDEINQSIADQEAKLQRLQSQAPATP